MDRYIVGVLYVSCSNGICLHKKARANWSGNACSIISFGYCLFFLCYEGFGMFLL